MHGQNHQIYFEGNQREGGRKEENIIGKKKKYEMMLIYWGEAYIR